MPASSGAPSALLPFNKHQSLAAHLLGIEMLIDEEQAWVIAVQGRRRTATTSWIHPCSRLQAVNHLGVLLETKEDAIRPISSSNSYQEMVEMSLINFECVHFYLRFGLSLSLSVFTFLIPVLVATVQVCVQGTTKSPVETHRRLHIFSFWFLLLLFKCVSMAQLSLRWKHME
ncbi:hypothetical protein Pint_36198 [Pistacia integerrima]|uniref:Uncharacterized protein n=1 Tax=Pistacia integerrima TaxID=434235 RepID=A0ACC0Y4A5_9ROSI|nr:hypothetical protein Pint_36198 [Pistacia integerrima]